MQKLWFFLPLLFLGALTARAEEPPSQEVPVNTDAPSVDDDLSGTLVFSAGGSFLQPTGHFAVEGGVRFGNLGLLAKVEWNPWFSVQEPGVLKHGVFNAGLGADIVYFGGRVRSGVFVGSSTLLFDTPLDEKGETGFFLEANLVTLRWEIKDRVWLSLTPAMVHVSIPVTGGIPLVMLAYRHAVCLEFVY